MENALKVRIVPGKATGLKVYEAGESGSGRVAKNPRPEVLEWTRMKVQVNALWAAIIGKQLLIPKAGPTLCPSCRQ
jgi:hypothetical protein